MDRQKSNHPGYAGSPMTAAPNQGKTRLWRKSDSGASRSLLEQGLIE